MAFEDENFNELYRRLDRTIARIEELTEQLIAKLNHEAAIHQGNRGESFEGFSPAPAAMENTPERAKNTKRGNTSRS